MSFFSHHFTSETLSSVSKWVTSFVPYRETCNCRKMLTDISSLTWAFLLISCPYPQLLFYFSNLSSIFLEFLYPNIKITFYYISQKLTQPFVVGRHVFYMSSSLPEYHNIPSLTWMQSKSLSCNAPKQCSFR